MAELAQTAAEDEVVEGGAVEGLAVEGEALEGETLKGEAVNEEVAGAVVLRGGRGGGFCSIKPGIDLVDRQSADVQRNEITIRIANNQYHTVSLLYRRVVKLNAALIQ